MPVRIPVRRPRRRDPWMDLIKTQTLRNHHRSRGGEARVLSNYLHAETLAADPGENLLLMATAPDRLRRVFEEHAREEEGHVRMLGELLERRGVAAAEPGTGNARDAVGLRPMAATQPAGARPRWRDRTPFHPHGGFAWMAAYKRERFERLARNWGPRFRGGPRVVLVATAYWLEMMALQVFRRHARLLRELEREAGSPRPELGNMRETLETILAEEGRHVTTMRGLLAEMVEADEQDLLDRLVVRIDKIERRGSMGFALADLGVASLTRMLWPVPMAEVA